ncbi:hypothetical protein PG984_010334 [Apiospora sp. TS-2023a]
MQDRIGALENAVQQAGSTGQDTGLLPTSITSLEAEMARLSMVGAATEKEHAIIKTLNFEARQFRYSGISEAHGKTFQWIFEDTNSSDSEMETSNFLEWLRHGDGIFWISGKPGAGKSTLMKFISHHETTKKALREWSRQQPVILASHFFWTAGTSMQKSKQGLLRTLLFEILRQQPDLVQQLCPERWEQSMDQISLGDWSVPELSQILQRVAHLKNPAAKLCFFIDGLDEYEGDHVEFCDTIQKLSSSPHVKICAASRPWNAFEDSFGRAISRKMYIHEHTRNDIMAYTRSRLESHPRWADVVEADNGDSLIRQVADKAAGVFLWVFLVARDLRSGMTEHDSFHDLERRLNMIPDDLEDFFIQILDGVEKFYHRKMAGMLLIAIAATRPEPPSIYNFYELECDDRQYALKATFKPLSSDQQVDIQNTTARRLNAITRGLLEINRGSDCVEFLHRSVKDFLHTDRMMEYLDQRVCTTFNAHLSLLRAWIYHTKKMEIPGIRVDANLVHHYEPPKSINEWEVELRRVFAYAKLADSYTEAHQLLECLDDGIQAISTGEAEQKSPHILCLREKVLEHMLVGYLRHIQPRVHDYFSALTNPALKYVLCEIAHSSQPKEVSRNELGFIQLLVQNGHNPNEPYSDLVNRPTTPWRLAFQLIGKDIVFRKIVSSGILTLLLEYGADPDATNAEEDLGPGDDEHSNTYSTVPAWLYIPYTLTLYESDMKSVKAEFILAMDLLETACRKIGSYPKEEDHFGTMRLAESSYISDWKRIAAIQLERPLRSVDDIRIHHIEILNRIFAHEPEHGSHYEFWVAVKARLLSIAILRGYDTDRRWPAIEGNFEPLSPSCIKSVSVMERNSNEPLDNVARSPQPQKRKRESQSEDDESFPKRQMQ